MKRLNFSWKYALIITGVVVLAFLVMDFNTRMAALRRLTLEKETVAAQLAGLQMTQTRLQTAIAYATSEAAVEDWAYEDGNLVRPGDNPIVPVGPGDSTPAPAPTPVVVTAQVSNWQMWLWLFVDVNELRTSRSP